MYDWTVPVDDYESLVYASPKEELVTFRIDSDETFNVEDHQNMLEPVFLK